MITVRPVTKEEIKAYIDSSKKYKHRFNVVFNLEGLNNYSGTDDFTGEDSLINEFIIDYRIKKQLDELINEECVT